jgi:GTPase SAR1 family protein
MNQIDWMEDVKRFAPQDTPMILVGNKVDLVDRRVIDSDKAKTFADVNGMKYMETSARDGRNVEDAFLSLGKYKSNVSLSSRHEFTKTKRTKKGIGSVPSSHFVQEPVLKLDDDQAQPPKKPQSDCAC